MYLTMIFRVALAISALVPLICCSSVSNSAEMKTLPTIQEQFHSSFNLVFGEADEKVNVLMMGWSDYIEEYEAVSNIDYLAAFTKLQIEYFEAIGECEKCMEEVSQSRGKHTSAWVDNLVKRYGIEYVRNNREAIMANIATSIGNDERICIQTTERLIFKEALLYAAYNRYLELFNKYFETLSYKDQELLKPQKDIVDLLSSSLKKASMAKIVFAGGKPSSLIAEIKARRLNEELYLFLRKYTTSPAFDPMIAIDDWKNYASKR